MEPLCLSRIRALRSERKLSQQAVADLLHVSQRTYSDYEAGKVRLHADKIVELARFYNVSADFLCGLTDRREPYPRR